MVSRPISLVISLSGISVALYFLLVALIDPINHVSFIFNTAMLAYLMEFLSLHAAAMLVDKKSKQYWLLGVYSLFAVTVGLIFFNWIAPLYFFVGVISKFFANRAIDNLSPIVLPVALFIFSTFVIIFAAPVIINLFPMPDSVLAQKPPNSSGLFVDTPQLLLACGILYYLLLVALEFLFYFKKIPANFIRIENNI